MSRTKRERGPESPWALLLFGLVIAGVGAIGLGTEGAFALVLLSVGCTLALVGCVGAGVAMGLLRADYVRQHHD